jgi:hypothetical protein
VITDIVAKDIFKNFITFSNVVPAFGTGVFQYCHVMRRACLGKNTVNTAAAGLGYPQRGIPSLRIDDIPD